MTAENGGDSAKAKRQRRLEEQLRENLKRRKEQARARRPSVDRNAAADDDAPEPGQDESARRED